MAEGQMMTAADVVARVMGGEHGDLLRDAVALVVREPIDLARRDAVDVGLHHDRHDRLLTAPPRLQKRRKVRRPRPRLGNQQLDLADARLPHARA